MNTNINTNVRTSTSTKRKYDVSIAVTDVAAILGKTPFSSRSQILERLWKRHQPETFKIHTDKELAEQAIDKMRCSGARDLVHLVGQIVMGNAPPPVAAPCTSLPIGVVSELDYDNDVDGLDMIDKQKDDDVEDSAAITAAAVAPTYEPMDPEGIGAALLEWTAEIEGNKAMTQAQKALLKCAVREKAYTAFGVVHEDRTADRLARELKSAGSTVVKDTKSYRRKFFTGACCTVTLSGRVDRMEYRADGSRRVIEIKNRVRKLFGNIK